MSDGTHPWKRLAAAVRHLDAETAKPVDPAQPTAAIPWLPELSGQVHAFLLRLIWKRWAWTAILLSFAVFAAFFIASRPASPPSRTPRIPIPSAP